MALRKKSKLQNKKKIQKLKPKGTRSKNNKSKKIKSTKSRKFGSFISDLTNLKDIFKKNTPTGPIYSKKEKIGVFGENQGMVCFEGTLYEDSTFYIKSDVFLEYAEGTFKKRGKNIYFKITGGDTKHFRPTKLIWNDTLNSYVNHENDAEINFVQFIK